MLIVSIIIITINISIDRTPSGIVIITNQRTIDQTQLSRQGSPVIISDNQAPTELITVGESMPNTIIKINRGNRVK